MQIVFLNWTQLYFFSTNRFISSFEEITESKIIKRKEKKEWKNKKGSKEEKKKKDKQRQNYYIERILLDCLKSS